MSICFTLFTVKISSFKSALYYFEAVYGIKGEKLSTVRKRESERHQLREQGIGHKVKEIKTGWAGSKKLAVGSWQ